MTTEERHKKSTNIDWVLVFGPISAGTKYFRESEKSRHALDRMTHTRFSEFLSGNLSKGVRWMPRLKKAMKDVVQLR